MDTETLNDPEEFSQCEMIKEGSRKCMTIINVKKRDTKQTRNNATAIIIIA